MRGALHLLLAAVPLLGGCFADAPKAPKNWSIEWDRTSVERNEKDALPAVKLSQFEVRAPYNGAHLAVLRPDGSIAFDSFNSFAAQPAALLKGAAFDSIEASGVFRGVYHVLGGRIAPLEGKGVESIDLAGLERRLDEGEIKEVILALSPGVEGQATAIYIANALRERKIAVSSPARGLPAGSDLSYADPATIAAALSGRIVFEK